MSSQFKNGLRESAVPLLSEPTQPLDAAGMRASRISFFNVLCTMVGVGVLGLPLCLHQGGWIAIGLVIIVAIVTNYSAKLIVTLLYCQVEKGGPRLASIPEIGYAAFGIWGQRIVEVVNTSTLIGIAALYMIVTASFISAGLFPDSSDDYQDKWTRYITLICGAIEFIPCLGLRNMKEVGFLSFFGMSASIIVVFFVVVFSIRENSLRPDDHSHKFINSEFPSALGTMALAFGGHSSFPAIEEHSPSPENFKKVVNVAFVVIVFLYMTTAAFGYWAYGDDVDSPILDSFPPALGAVITAKCIIAFHCLAALPIMLHSVFSSYEHRYPMFELFVNRCVVRGAIVCFCILIAYFIPFFGDFMSLLGALFMSLVVFVFPVIFNLKLRHDKISKGEKIFGWVVIVLGIVGGTLGSIDAIEALVDDLQDN